ncbi:hypothetical protein, partial [Streptomyces sp. LUP30]|uniref:hypothetical protein n=1 Tax=Streptomyces sp. LUP30 TaxID=1890285 RepID=UPI001C406424
PVVVWVFSAGCALFFTWVGRQPGAPLFTRAPWIVVDRLMPDRPRPDYARIERLERELGLTDEEPRRPVRRASRACLVKDCRGDTQTVETWGGQVLYRVHRCEGGQS